MAANLKRKRQNSSSKPSASGGRALQKVSRQEIAAGKKTAGSTPPPAASASPAVPSNGVASPATQVESGPRPDGDIRVVAGADPADEERRLREEMDARLRDQGFLPFVADLEGCRRVGAVGLELFRKMAADVPAEMGRILRGKIASVISENHIFADRLGKVQKELDAQRDNRYLDLSSENRDLREKAERLQGLAKEQEEARKTISTQTAQLEALPGIKAERDRIKEGEEKLRKEAEALKKWVEELSSEKTEAEKRAATASLGGYQHAVNLSSAVAPWLTDHAVFFDGKHHARDGKVWLGDEMVYDPALPTDEEENQANL